MMETIDACECVKHRARPAEIIENNEHGVKDSGFVKNLSYYFAEFCRNTSLHGLKFLGEQGRSVVEKLWWFIVIAVSLYFCSGLIANLYHKWQMIPVIVNFATSQTPIFQIPFPAVTICPETKSNTSMFNYSEMHAKWKNNSLNLEEAVFYEYMSQICINKENLTTLFVDENMLDFITKAAPTIQNSLWKCRWMSEYEDCSKLFVPVLTEAGVCFSFNILDHEEVFADDVYRYQDFQKANKTIGWAKGITYSEEDDIESYPQRALSSSAKAGLSLTLETTRADIDHICSAGMQGYRVQLHHPADMPSIEEHYFRLPLDEAVVVAINPRVMTTNEKLSSYPPDQRKCYFPKEKPLRFFKIYSQQNCHVECLTNFTLNSCKCVAFYMPRVKSTPICGAAKRRCLMFAEGAFLAMQASNKMKRWVDDIPENDININNSCDCLPSCNSTYYDEETSQTPWDWKRFYDSEEFRQKINETPTHNSKLIIYFKEKQIMPSQRNELYGDTDFIANCGGLLGLFIGFSFISLIELIYFLTLRFACNLRTYGRHYWSGNPELLNQK